MCTLQRGRGLQLDAQFSQRVRVRVRGEGVRARASVVLVDDRCSAETSTVAGSGRWAGYPRTLRSTRPGSMHRVAETLREERARVGESERRKTVQQKRRSSSSSCMRFVGCIQDALPNKPAASE